MLTPDQSVQPTRLAQTARAARRAYVLPIVTLLLLSPLIAEVLFGSTSLSTLYVLPVEIGTCCCGTLLIRSLVRSLRRGWIAILLLGIALALAEECLIQQTSLAPLVGVNPAHVYGRIFGVNWLYLLFQLGYESLWVVMVPIQLTELLFPSHRDDPWVGLRGRLITGVVFVLAAFAAWYSWTHLARPAFHLPVYNPPPLAIGITLLTMVGLVVVALIRPRSPGAIQMSKRTAPSPWLMGGASFVFSLVWFGLLALAYNAAPPFPAVLAMAFGIVWVSAAWAVLTQLATRREWHDLHRLALVFGACGASMGAGFVLHVVVLPIDIIGKLVFNVLALFWLSFLAWQISRRKAHQSPTDS